MNIIMSEVRLNNAATQEEYNMNAFSRRNLFLLFSTNGVIHVDKLSAALKLLMLWQQIHPPSVKCFLDG